MATVIRETFELGRVHLEWRLVNGRETFTGGLEGEHSIAGPDEERAKEHWAGYVENNRRAYLKQQLAKLSPERHQDIRDAYYKAAEALSALATATELGDLDLHAEQGDEAGPLIEEHLTVCQALDAFNQLNLGRFV